MGGPRVVDRGFVRRCEVSNGEGPEGWLVFDDSISCCRVRVCRCRGQDRETAEPSRARARFFKERNGVRSVRERRCCRRRFCEMIRWLAPRVPGVGC